MSDKNFKAGKEEGEWSDQEEEQGIPSFSSIASCVIGPTNTGHSFSKKAPPPRVGVVLA